MSSLGVAWTAAVLVVSAVGLAPADPPAGGAVPVDGARSAEEVRGTVTGLQVLPSVDQTEVVISLDGWVETRDFTMEGPFRIVVDLMDARFGLPTESFEGVGRGGVRNIRAGQYAPDVVRIVLEVDELVGYTLISADGYVRISMENRWGPFDPWAAIPDVLPASVPPALAGLPPTVATSPVPATGGGPSPAPVAGSVRFSGIRASSEAERITVSFHDIPIRDVIFTFADFSGRSIVPGTQVTGNVSAEIRDQPWDIALQAILESHELAAQEQASGIIRVDPLDNLMSRETVEQLVTRPFRVSYANAAELAPSIESLLTDRGRVSVNPTTNTLVVTDIPRVLESVEQLLQGLDLRTPEITISAKIMFVNRTDLQEFGVVYDLKDSRGNQLNQITPGGIDRDGDGRISEDEFVDVGTNVISLGGNSIAALGNANQRVVGPSLQFLTSLILGRHTLVSFVEALQSVNLSDVQAAPQITTLDNQQARILVGERTPIRVLDAGGATAAQPGGQFPQATVQIEETGIILEVTPHVTAGDLIWMDLRAERSGIEIAEADVGFIFNTQEANTRVLVADGETVVIGGLTVTERSEVRAGIPLLQDLPLVGRLFRLTREQRTQRDLMILVTPHINRR